MASDKGVPVELYIYDLTHGMAALLSPAILGRQVSGVWHTSVVVYEREYFYGGAGVTSCAPGGTQLGQPHQVERLGETFVPFSVFVDYIQGLATTTYTGGAYRLLEHNCNHFSEEVSQFLCGAHVPKHILTQPDALPPPLRLAVQALLDNVLPTPQGPLVPPRPRPRPADGRHVYAPLAGTGWPTTICFGQAGLNRGPADGVRRARDESPEYFTLNQQIEQARAQGAALEQRRSTLAEKLARKERRREKKRKKHARASGDMAEAVEAYPAEELSAGPSGPSGASRPADPDVDDQPEERRLPKEPPIVYKDIDGAAEYEKLAAALQTLTLTPEEQQSLQELQQYLVQGEGSWVLGDDFLAFIGRILTDPSMSSAREPTLRCLAAAALREDVSLVLHQDRKHHALLTYAHGIDTHPAPEQQALALFMCNLFSNISSSEWLLYISEWDHAGQPLSNIRATTKVCVHATLSEDPELRELGTALMYNVATKEVKTVRLGATRPLRSLLPKKAKSKVFDEVCIELAMALLQLLAWAPSEEHMFRACLALARLAAHSADVPQLVAMVDVEPSAFLGTSARVDEQINLFVKKLK